MLGSFECQCQRGYEMMNGNCIGMAEFNFNDKFFKNVAFLLVSYCQNVYSWIK